MIINKLSKYNILVFRNIHEVIKAEQVIQKLGLAYQIVPVPSNISSECGMCIELYEISTNQLYTEFDKLNLHYKVYPK